MRTFITLSFFLCLISVGCTKEIQDTVDVNYLSDRSFLLIEKTPEIDTVVGTYYFFEGLVQVYQNNKFVDVGEYWFDRVEDYPHALCMQAYPFGYRSFYIDIVGTGQVIRLQGINRQRNYVLKLK